MDNIKNIRTCNDLLELQELIKNDSSHEIPQGKITRSFLINAWENNILSDKGYVFLIICMFYSKNELSQLDCNELSELWEGMGINGKKPKKLEASSVNKALIDIQDAGIIFIKNAQSEFNIELNGI
jgi:hypothetical protein